MPTAAIVWSSQAPANFAVTYTVNTHAALCTWSAVSPTPHDYCVYKWNQDGYGTVYYCYEQLVSIEPSAQPFFTDFNQKVDTLLNSPGLTYTERQALLNAIEVDLDAMNGILCASAHPSAPGLLTQLKNAYQTRRDNGTSTTWNDTSCNDNTFYWYSVVTRNSSHTDTSALSHTEVIYAIRDDRRTPSAPTLVSPNPAKAYDPGVFVKWNRSTAYDLAGYNVYRQDGSSWVKLNASLITTGTEYYYDLGTVGQVFAVTVVDTSSRESNRSASSNPAVLQAATVYQADDAGWGLTPAAPPERSETVMGYGWVIEHYTTANLLVGHNITGQSNATASHSFTGRRVKFYASTYWECGNVNVYIDGVLEATVNLYYYDIPIADPEDPDDLTPRTTRWAQNVFTLSGLSEGAHTFMIECVGSGSAGGANFVNVQYIEVR